MLATRTRWDFGHNGRSADRHRCPRGAHLPVEAVKFKDTYNPYQGARNNALRRHLVVWTRHGCRAGRVPSGSGRAFCRGHATR